MTTQHTKGPWSIGDWDRIIDGNGETLRVLGVALPHSDSDEIRANRRLIAAAPELLAFAQEFLADYQSEDGFASMKHYAGIAHALVAKATGG